MKTIFGILLWLVYVPVSLFATILSYFLAPILVFFCNSDGYLPKWLWWFQTPDNPLDGDGGWKREHWQWRFKLPTPLATYVGRVGWLWRNPTYGFSINVLGAKNPPEPFNWYGNRDIKNGTNPVNGWLIVTSGVYWNVYIIAPFFGRTFRLYMGWKLRNGEGRNPYQMVCYVNPFKSRA